MTTFSAACSTARCIAMCCGSVGSSMGCPFVRVVGASPSIVPGDCDSPPQSLKRRLVGTDPRGESAAVVHEPKFCPGEPLNATQQICEA